MNDRLHALYRFFDAEGRLLYIGISMNPPYRFGQHADDKPWWAEVARIAMETFPDRSAVLAAERRAIQTEQPLYNVVHNRTNKTPAIPGQPHLNIRCEVCDFVVTKDGYLIVYGDELREAEKSWREYESRRQRDRAASNSSWEVVPLGEMLELGEAKWHVLHAACDPRPDRGDYALHIERPLTALDLLDHTLHLIGKVWIDATNWHRFVRALVHQGRPHYDPEEEAPIAWARPAGDVWVVSSCPYCGDKHEHAAGGGLRVSHCHRGEYVLRAEGQS